MMRTLEELRSSPARGRTLLGFVEDPVVVLTRDRTVVYFNPPFEKRFQAAWHTGIGSKLENLLPAYISSKIGQYMDHLGALSSPQRFFAEGEEESFRISLAPVSQNGRVIGAVVTLWEATAEAQIKRLNLALLEALTEDLHLPLAELEGFVSMLTQRPDKLSTLQKQSQAQMAQISQALARLRDFSEMLFGRLVPAWVPFRPLQLLALARKTLSQAAAERKVHLEEAVAVDLPQVMGDPAFLNRVLGIILDYLIKSVPRRQMVVMSAALLDMPEASPRLVYSLTGTGWILPEELLSRITGLRHAPALSDTEIDKQALIRLLLARRLIQAMKGTLTLAAHEAAGTTFSFSIPTIVVPAATEDAQEPPANRG